MTGSAVIRTGVLALATLLGSATAGLAQSEPRSRPGCQDRESASFTQLFTGTVSGLRQLPSKDTLGLLTLGSFATIASRPVDLRFTKSFSGIEPLHDTFEPGRIIGGSPLQLGAAFATYGIGRALNKPCAVSLGADLIQAQLMAEALTIGMKQAFRRSRPEGSGFSFPSGHTSVTFASASVLQRHYGWKVGLPAYAVASYVAASRVQTKRHYLSDVAFGAALGIAAGHTVTIGRGKHRFELAPMAAPGGGGASLTWIGDSVERP